MGGTDLQREHKQAETQNNGREIRQAVHRNKDLFRILIADFVLSSAWVCSSPIIKLIVHKFLGLGHDHTAEVISYAFKIMNMFFFSVLGSSTKGGSHNPLAVLTGAVSADFNRLVFTLGARIPAQVLGSIVGVKLLIATFSDVGQGPKLSVEIHHGALAEGILAFIIAIISMELARSLSGSFYRKNWISSISKIALQILTSDLTGACMNPASAMGWAYARGDHLTKEHILVYWLAPGQATLLAVQVFKLLLWSGRDEKVEKKTKAE